MKVLKTGPAEAWDVVELPDNGFAFSTLWGTYLSVEADGSLRADAQSIEDSSIFYIKCQAKNRQTTRKKQVFHLLQQIKLASEIEVEQLKSRYSFGGKLEKLISKDKESLESAKRIGRLNEELVIRRARVTNDRYCK